MAFQYVWAAPARRTCGLVGRVGADPVRAEFDAQHGAVRAPARAHLRAVPLAATVAHFFRVHFSASVAKFGANWYGQKHNKIKINF